MSIVGGSVVSNIERSIGISIRSSGGVIYGVVWRVA